MLEAIESSLLIVLLLAAAWWDLRHRRVPNALTVPFLLAGLVIASLQGPGELAIRVAWMLVVLIAGFVLYLGRVVGGGDAKFVAAIAALKGAGFLGESMIWTAGVSLVVSAAILAARRDLFPFLGRVARAFVQVAFWRLTPDEVVREGGRKIPFAVVIAAGTAIALVAEWQGVRLIR